MTDQIGYEHFIVERKGHVRPGLRAVRNGEGNEGCVFSEDIRVNCGRYDQSVA
jgi:hypothetical protein